jgi:hypothetical protein
MPWTARSETPPPRWRLFLWRLRRSRRAETWFTPPTETAPGSAKTARYNGYRRVNPDTIAKISLVGFLAFLVLCVVLRFVTPPEHPSPPFNGGGGVLWKATGYQMDDGWGINLEGSGRPIQITLGTSADLEVDGGYFSSGGHIAFLRPGTAPTFQDCLSALGPASSQEEPLTAIIPGRHADLCSSGSGGDIAYMHVTRSDQSGLTMNITIWEYLP